MNRVENRKKFMKKLKVISDSFELTDELKDILRKNRYFGETFTQLENDFTTNNTTNNEMLKAIILLEFTKEREGCNEIITIFRELGNINVTSELSMINKSSEKLFDTLDEYYKLSSEPIITVEKACIPKNNSTDYKMTQKPRGKCLIINNVKKHAKNESQRFKHVFDELYFTTNLKFDLDTIEIIEQLSSIYKILKEQYPSSNEPQNEQHKSDKTKDEALIIMIISHGKGDKILGSTACKLSDAKETTPKEQLDTIEDQIKQDMIAMNYIIQMFAEFLIPKVFIFDCCRPKSDFEFINTWENNNCLQTFVINSCCEGYDSYPGTNHTIFGQIFSHCIAKYAHDEYLDSIVERTEAYLNQLKEHFLAFDPEQACFKSEGLGIDFRKYRVARKLNFKVGW